MGMAGTDKEYESCDESPDTAEEEGEGCLGTWDDLSLPPPPVNMPPKKPFFADDEGLGEKAWTPSSVTAVAAVLADTSVDLPAVAWVGVEDDEEEASRCCWRYCC